MSDKAELMKMISRATGRPFEWDPGEEKIRLTLPVIDDEDGLAVGLSVCVDLRFNLSGCLCAIESVLDGYDPQKWTNQSTENP